MLSKHHIKDVQKLHEYQCKVCFEVDPTIMRCSGPCKGALCLKCATAICRTSYHTGCPQRCSQPLNLQPIPHLQMQFSCPYDGERCKEKIEGHDAFIEHRGKCQHITSEAVEEQLRNEEFVCKQGHHLSFINMVTLEELSLDTFTLPCTKCDEKRICRSYCKQCTTLQKLESYCNDCRTLPCTKEFCPIGHEYIRVAANDNNLYCDLCGFCIFLYSDHCYLDEACNFGFCGTCYQKVPDNHPLVPLEDNVGQMNENFHMNHMHGALHNVHQDDAVSHDSQPLSDENFNLSNEENDSNFDNEDHHQEDQQNYDIEEEQEQEQEQEQEEEMAHDEDENAFEDNDDPNDFIYFNHREEQIDYDALYEDQDEYGYYE